MVIDINDSFSFGHHHCNNNDHQHHQGYDDGDAHALLAALVVLLRLNELLFCALDVVSALCHVGLDAVDLFALCEH